MGVSSLILEELYWRSAQHVAIVGRAYLTQSVALVTISRRIVPIAGIAEGQQRDLKKAIQSMSEALEYARNVGHRDDETVNQKYQESINLFCGYLHKYHDLDRPLQDEIANQLQLLLPSSSTKEISPVPGTAKPFAPGFQGEKTVAIIEQLQQHDKLSAQHLNRLEEALGIKLKYLFSSRKTTIEVWIWHDIPLEATSQADLEQHVCRPKMVFEERLNLDYILCRLLDRHTPDSGIFTSASTGLAGIQQEHDQFCGYMPISLAHNPHFYRQFPSRRESFRSSSIIRPLECTFQAALLEGKGTSHRPSILHLIFDRQTSFFVDIAETRSRAFGNVWRALDSAVVLKDKMGEILLADDLENGRLVKDNQAEFAPLKLSFWSCPSFTIVGGRRGVICAANISPLYDFIVSSEPPSVGGEGESTPYRWKPNQGKTRAISGAGSITSLSTVPSDATLVADGSTPSLRTDSTTTLTDHVKPNMQLSKNRPSQPSPLPLLRRERQKHEDKSTASASAQVAHWQSVETLNKPVHNSHIPPVAETSLSSTNRMDLNRQMQTTTAGVRFLPVDGEAVPLESDFAPRRKKPEKQKGFFQKLFGR